jgi:hypothetical protein
MTSAERRRPTVARGHKRRHSGQPSPGALRKRAYRVRRKEDRYCYTVELSGQAVVTLLQWNWFAEGADTRTIGEAISRELEAATKRGQMALRPRGQMPPRIP